MKVTSIQPHKEYGSFEAKCGLYLTNSGLYAEYQCIIQGSLLITEDRIERHYLFFSDLKSFVNWCKANAFDVKDYTDLQHSNHVEVGYLCRKYFTDYGMLHIYTGVWMDDFCMWEVPKRYTTYLGNPNNWL